MNEQAEMKVAGAPAWTSGPWVIESRVGLRDGVNVVFGIVAADGHTIASGQSMEHLGGEGILEAECRANAQLMAAAPKLYAALEILFNDYKARADSGDSGFWKLEDTDEGKLALAVLAEARGEVQP